MRMPCIAAVIGMSKKPKSIILAPCLPFPAIDIIDGCCVRLLQGQFDKKSVYGENPAAVAQSFAEAGASRLHVVDLDAARGNRNNRISISAIRHVFPGIVEVGGGVRSPEDVVNLLELGIDRLIVGTALVQRPEEVAEWTKRFGPVFIAGIDARDGLVKVSGWEEGSAMRAADPGRQSKTAGYDGNHLHGHCQGWHNAGPKSGTDGGDSRSLRPAGYNIRRSIRYGRP